MVVPLCSLAPQLLGSIVNHSLLQLLPGEALSDLSAGLMTWVQPPEGTLRPPAQVQQGGHCGHQVASDSGPPGLFSQQLLSGNNPGPQQPGPLQALSDPPLFNEAPQLLHPVGNGGVLQQAKLQLHEDDWACTFSP
eukprot:11179230-Lingulodinium_polyedra.AAC.1